MAEHDFSSNANSLALKPIKCDHMVIARPFQSIFSATKRRCENSLTTSMKRRSDLGNLIASAVYQLTKEEIAKGRYQEAQNTTRRCRRRQCSRHVLIRSANRGEAGDGSGCSREGDLPEAEGGVGRVGPAQDSGLRSSRCILRLVGRSLLSCYPQLTE